jgi:mRNA-degrading endonuclease RelE of RelBE toxin-antitoxin system
MARVFLEPKAEREFKKLPRDVRLLVHGILTGIFSTDPLSPVLDVRKMQPPLPGYRLRIGEYRVLFTLENDIAKVYRIRHRKDAYR